MWKEHFKNLLRNSPKVANKPITKIINNQLDINPEEFTQEEHDVVRTKIKNKEAARLGKVFNDLQLRYFNAVYNQNTKERWTKGCILPFTKKDALGIVKNYRGITYTSVAAKIYNALPLNRIEPEIEKILRKMKIFFRKNRSITSQILTICRILERKKTLSDTLINRCLQFDSIHRGKMEQILLAYDLSKEAFTSIMKFYKKRK